MEHESVTRIPNHLLNMIGFQPNGRLNYSRLSLSLSPVVLTLFLAIYLLITGDIVFEEFTNCVETIITEIHVTVKYLILIVIFRKIQQLARKVQDSITITDLDGTSYKMYLKEISGIKLISTSFVTTAAIVGSIMLIRPLLSNELVMVFYVPNWVPDWATTIFCIYDRIPDTAILITLDTSVFTLISLLALQIKLLNRRIPYLGIGGGLNDEFVSWKIEQFVQAHVNFYRNFRSLNSIIRWIVLVECIMFIMTMSFELHLTVNRIGDLTNLFKSLSYIVAIIFEIFAMYCWPSSKLTTETTNTLFCLYDTPWYKASLSVQKSLLIIMTRLQRETVVCLGNTIVVNLELFTNVFKLSYSYFTTLQAMQQVYSR